MKAREWLERGNGAASPIDALRDYWAGFNNLYASDVKADERTKICTYLRKSVSLSTAETILTENLNGVDYLLSQPVIDMPWMKKDTSHFIEAFQVAQDSLEKLVNVFIVVYQVRCNLEHGQKSPSRERDVQLCAYSAPIVAKVIEHCA